VRRDPIYAALLAQLQALATAAYSNLVSNIGRGFVHWDQCDVQPAVFIVPTKEIGDYVRGTPVKWVLTPDIYVYVRWTDSVSQGVTALAQVMDAIDAILSPTGKNGSMNAGNAVNTLGGLVSYCALKGTGEVSGGFLNRQQTIARMPVEIMVAG
jgi:hypothetical protein